MKERNESYTIIPFGMMSGRNKMNVIESRGMAFILNKIGKAESLRKKAFKLLNIDINNKEAIDLLNISGNMFYIDNSNNAILKIPASEVIDFMDVESNRSENKRIKKTKKINKRLENALDRTNNTGFKVYSKDMKEVIRFNLVNYIRNNVDGTGDVIISLNDIFIKYMGIDKILEIDLFESITKKKLGKLSDRVFINTELYNASNNLKKHSLRMLDLYTDYKTSTKYMDNSIKTRAMKKETIIKFFHYAGCEWKIFNRDVLKKAIKELRNIGLFVIMNTDNNNNIIFIFKKEAIK